MSLKDLSLVLFIYGVQERRTATLWLWTHNRSAFDGLMNVPWPQCPANLHTTGLMCSCNHSEVVWLLLLHFVFWNNRTRFLFFSSTKSFGNAIFTLGRVIVVFLFFSYFQRTDLEQFFARDYTKRSSCRIWQGKNSLRASDWLIVQFDVEKRKNTCNPNGLFSKSEFSKP